MTSFRGLAESVVPHLPQETFAKWASVFFTLSVWTLLISIAATQAFLALSVLCYVAHLFRETSETKRKILFPPVKLPVAIFCVWTFVSMFFAENRATGGFVIRKLVLFVILLIALNVVRSLRHLEFLFLGIFMESGLAGLFGMAQFVKEYFHVSAAFPQRIYAHMMLTRITGFMGHWMNFSGQQMMAFTSLAALLLIAAWPKGNAQPLPASRRTRIAGWILLGIIALSIFLSFTRGVWLGCFVGIVYLVARRFPRWLWVLPVLVVAGYFVSPRMVRERVNQALHPSSDRSVSIRFEMWHAGWKMIQRHPWVGVGPDNIPEVYPLYLPPGKAPEIGYHDHLHDNFIQFAAERGLPCLVAWLWLMGALAWHAIRIRRQLPQGSPGKWVTDAALAGWLAFLTEGFFEFNFGTSPVLMVFLFLVTTPFILEAVSRKTRSPQPSES